MKNMRWISGTEISAILKDQIATLAQAEAKEALFLCCW